MKDKPSDIVDDSIAQSPALSIAIAMSSPWGATPGIGRAGWKGDGRTVSTAAPRAASTAPWWIFIDIGVSSLSPWSWATAGAGAACVRWKRAIKRDSSRIRVARRCSGRYASGRFGGRST